VRMVRLSAQAQAANALADATLGEINQRTEVRQRSRRAYCI